MPDLEERFELDLIDADDRAAAWCATTPQLFPGLSVVDIGAPPAAASVRGFRFGAGCLWRLVSPPLKVSYQPPAAAGVPSFSLMLQTQGCTIATQSGKTCRLETGDLCLIDGEFPFELEVNDLSHLSFLQIPREAVLSRHAYLRERTAEAFDTHDPGVHLLRQALQASIDLAPTLNSEQRNAALLCITQLLGMPRLTSQEPSRDVSWRVRAALALIEAELARPHLNAEYVAQRQGISRRRLDQLLTATIGVPISKQICSRRIERAAEILTDPQFATSSISQVGFAVGFDDAAHFTRAFKQHFDCTPLEWRKEPGAQAPSTSAGRLSYGSAIRAGRSRSDA